MKCLYDIQNIITPFYKIKIIVIKNWNVKIKYVIFVFFIFMIIVFYIKKYILKPKV